MTPGMQRSLSVRKVTCEDCRSLSLSSDAQTAQYHYVDIISRSRASLTLHALHTESGVPCLPRGKRPGAYLVAKRTVPNQSADRSKAGAEWSPGQRGIPSGSPPTTETCPAGSEPDVASD